MCAHARVCVSNGEHLVLKLHSPVTALQCLVRVDNFISNLAKPNRNRNLAKFFLYAGDGNYLEELFQIILWRVVGVSSVPVAQHAGLTNWCNACKNSGNKKPKKTVQ